MKKILTIIFIQLSCFLMVIPASDISSFSDQYQHLLDLWINNNISLQKMLKFLSDLDTDIDKNTLSWKTYYWKSRVSFLRGQIYYEKKENKLSIHELENCLYFAGQANEQKEMSKIISTMAEANSLLILQKSFLFKVANFSVSQELAEKALKLNPENFQASLVRAKFLCIAPPIAGGNLEKGIKMLKDLSERNSLSTPYRFYVLQSLAEVYRNNNRKKDAAITCEQALIIYPGNRRCREMLSELK